MRVFKFNKAWVINILRAIPVLIVLIILFPFLFPLVPDFRFGPDIRLSSKVIDPDEAGFDIHAFRFDDYNDYDDLAYVLSTAFPKGMDMSEVLSKFESGFGELKPLGISPHQNMPPFIPNDDNRYSVGVAYNKLYRFDRCALAPKSDTDMVIFRFDQNKKLLSVYVRYSCTMASAQRK